MLELHLRYFVQVHVQFYKAMIVKFRSDENISKQYLNEARCSTKGRILKAIKTLS
jgi:hypothetical protein